MNKIVNVTEKQGVFEGNTYHFVVFQIETVRENGVKTFKETTVRFIGEKYFDSIKVPFDVVLAAGQNELADFIGKEARFAYDRYGKVIDVYVK